MAISDNYNNSELKEIKNEDNQEIETNNEKVNANEDATSDENLEKLFDEFILEELSQEERMVDEFNLHYLEERLQEIEKITLEDENNELIANNPEYYYDNIIIPQKFNSFKGGVINPKWIACSYSHGFFPWYDQYSLITWHRPKHRAVFYVKKLTFGRTIRKLIRRSSYEVWINRDKEQTIKNCALPRASEQDTWINKRIINVYPKLPNFLSVEVYNQDQLVGGLYGTFVGGTFCGESMFNFKPDTAKIAFFALCQICLENKIKLIDSQVLNDFTKSLGAVEITNGVYQKHLKKYLNQELPKDIYLERQIILDSNLFKKS